MLVGMTRGMLLGTCAAAKHFNAVPLGALQLSLGAGAVELSRVAAKQCNAVILFWKFLEVSPSNVLPLSTTRGSHFDKFDQKQTQ